MFERFTPEALQAVFFARFEASHDRSQELDTTHLMLGVLRKHRDFTHSPGISELDAALRHSLKERSPGAPAVSTFQDLPVSEECKRALAFTSEEADSLGHAQIGCEHILLGILREEDSTLSAMLRERGVTLDDLRERTRSNPPSGER